MVLEVRQRTERLERPPQFSRVATYAGNLENFGRAIAALARHGRVLLIAEANRFLQFQVRNLELRVFTVRRTLVEFGHILARRRRSLPFEFGPLRQLVLEFDRAVAARSEDVGHGEEVLVALGDAQDLLDTVRLLVDAAAGAVLGVLPLPRHELGRL